MQQHNLHPTRTLKERLVMTLVKCGALDDALQVFLELQNPTAFSWTALISGFTDFGNPREALQMYVCMAEEGLEANAYTFVSLFKTCRLLAEKEAIISVLDRSIKPISLEIGRALHANARRKCLDKDVFVGSTLVSMYGKCRATKEAEQAFNQLIECNVVSWNAMISTYVEQGEAENALHLHRQMQLEGMAPDECSFVTSLQACGILAEKEDAVGLPGQSRKSNPLKCCNALHADAGRKGLDLSLFVGNTLISVYGKCGSIVEAQNVFTGLLCRDLVSWNAMLSAYVEGDEDTALHLYRQMQKEGIEPDIITFVYSLQACCMLAEKEEATPVDEGWTKAVSLEIGQALHADTKRHGLHSEVFICSTLVTVYKKCGSILHAQNAFNSVSLCDVVSWSAMLSVYVEQGQEEMALQLFLQMQADGVDPDEHTYVTVLEACCKIADKETGISEGQSRSTVSLEIGQGLRADLERNGYDTDPLVSSTIVNFYSALGDIEEAENIFQGFYGLNVVSWNSMLHAYVEQVDYTKALGLYRQMQGGINPDEETFAVALQACCLLAEKEEFVLLEGQQMKPISLEIGQSLHADARKKGFDGNGFVGSALLTMYGKCGSIPGAENVFSQLPHIDVVSSTAMLSGYVEQGEGGKALRLFELMQKNGMLVDDATLVCVLQACSETANLEICRQIHLTIVHARHDLSLLLANSLICAYGSCASMEDGQAVFDTLQRPNVVSWTALIAGYAREGNYMASLNSFERMQLTESS